MLATDNKNGLQHQTVLLHEAVEALVWKPEGVYVDGTFGRGGHSRLILNKLSAGGKLLAFDKDPQALAEACRIEDVRFGLEHDSFAGLRDAVSKRGLGSVSGVLLDLGVSSPQIDEAQRGFSFRHDGPLDMRMNNTQGVTAAEWLAVADESEIARVIRDYGEERFAIPIAKAIVARRQQSAELGPLTRTAELAALVATAVKTREKGQDPATRTFQALRIFVNQELEDLTCGLDAALDALETGGRLVVISFHSLEDRIVKRFMQAHARPVAAFTDSRTAHLLRRLPLEESRLAQPRLKLLGKLKPSDNEVAGNPRARSAIMRIAEKLH